MHVAFGVRRIVPLLPLVAVLLAVAPAVGREEENPILALVKSRVKDPDKSFTLIVRLQAREGAGDKLEKVFGPAIKATRKEKGCVVYELNRDTRKPSQYLVYERWKNVAALAAHLNSPHIKKLLAELPDVTTGMPEANILVPAGE
jgi:quinol monooxygenase YgiN